MSINPTLLFQTSAFLNAISVPGHIVLGLQKVHPTLNTIPDTDKSKKQLVGKRSAQACFNYINASLAIAGTVEIVHMFFPFMKWNANLIPQALLNLQWAKTGGPKTFEEKSIFWILVVGGFFDGLTYITAEEYAPLGCMWFAPLASIAGYYLS